MSKKKEKVVYQYKDLKLDSKGEEDLCYYFEELIEAGYLEKFERGESYELSKSLVNKYQKQLKTKSKEVTKTIMFGHSYEYDFKLTWTKLGKSIFCSKFGENITKPFIIDSNLNSRIEAKPIFDYGNMTRLAIINTKWVWDKYNIYIQIIKSDELFKETFLPKKLFKTPTGKIRVLKYKPKLLEEYIKEYEQTNKP